MRFDHRVLSLVVLLAPSSLAVQAQTIDDSVMMPRRALCTGLLYGHDGWSRYWEGTLKRSNGNIGTLTTQSVSWVGSYGVTDRLNVIAVLPFVWTRASAGTLHGMHGLQDLTLAAKLDLLDTALTSRGSLRAIAVGSFGTPLSDYTPDFMPLSIGSASRRASGRLTLSFQAQQGWFVRGSGAYTWRGNVTLDRSSYFTDGRLYLTDQVAMPDVFDYTVSAGYARQHLQVPISFSQQYTRGGGDIRRQDAPFVSNKMNFSKLDALVMYSVPSRRDLALRLEAAYTLDGRNVGQATTLTAGLLYTFHF